MKLTKLTQRHGRHIWILSISLCLVCVISCARMSGPREPTLHYNDTPCSPAEVRSQLQQYFTSQNIRTSEETDGRKINITTTPIEEPRQGNREMRAIYVVEIQPSDSADTSRVALTWIIESRGIRERTWYEEKDAPSEPKYRKPISQQLQSLCRSARQQEEGR